MANRFWTMGAACAAFLATGAVLAQDISADQGTGSEDTPADSTPRPEPKKRLGVTLDEIVVTAERREAAVNDVPIAISAFKGEDMKALGITDTRDLALIVPGFTAADNGNNTVIYTLRGVGYNDTTYTATSTVGIYLDEINMPYSVMSKGANLDLERVEVLKGPQGTLYGRNTTGGAVNYIAAKPTDTFDYGGSASYGRFQTVETEAFVSGPLTDTLRARVAGKVIRAFEGWQYSNTRPDDTLGEKKKYSGRLTVEWEPDTAVLVRLMVDGWRDRSDTQAPQAIGIQPQNPFVQNDIVLAPGVRNYPIIDQDTDDMRLADWPQGAGPVGGALGNPEGVGGEPWEHNDTYWRAALTSKADLADWISMTAIAAYGQVESDGTTIPASGLDVQNVEQIITAEIKTMSGELRFDGTINDTMSWLAGANVAYDDGFEDHHVFVPTTSAVFPLPILGTSVITTEGINHGETKALSIGMFGKFDWQFLDDWQISLGARYSKERREYAGCFIEPTSSQGVGIGTLFAVVSLLQYGNPLNVPMKGQCLNVDDNGNSGLFEDVLKEQNVSGRAALTWTPNEDMLYYASFSRGFKSGGYPVLNASQQQQLRPSQQERLHAYEVGAKITVIPGELQINTALYYYNYVDKQLSSYFVDPIFGVLPILVNVPKSTVKGAELDFQWTPLEGLFMAFSGAYVNTRVDEYTGVTAKGQRLDFSGSPFNFAPSLQFTVLADYSFAVSSGLVGGIGADFRYTNETNATFEEDPLYAMRANSMVGARLRLGDIDGRWTVSVWGRNLLNEFSAIGVFRAGDAVARTTGQPRTYGITLSVRNF